MKGASLEEDLKKAWPTSKTLGKCLVVTKMLPLLQSRCCRLKTRSSLTPIIPWELVPRPLWIPVYRWPSPLNNTRGTCIYPRKILLSISYHLYIMYNIQSKANHVSSYVPIRVGIFFFKHFQSWLV